MQIIKLLFLLVFVRMRAQKKKIIYWLLFFFFFFARKVPMTTA